MVTRDHRVDLPLDDVHIDVRGDGIEVSLGHSASFDIAVDVSAWFAPGELASAQPSGGVIAIDVTHNLDLAVKVAGRLKSSFSLMTEPLVQ